MGLDKWVSCWLGVLEVGENLYIVYLGKGNMLTFANENLRS